MEKFEQEYRKWGRVVLPVLVGLLFTTVIADYLLEFDFSKNYYLCSIIASGILLGLLSMSWIQALNARLMRTDPKKPLKAGESRAITMEDIEMCVRKEGYVPQPDEEHSFFKIAGERYDVYYQDEKFTLVKRYSLGEDVDRALLYEVCSQTQAEIFLFRNYIHTLDDKAMLLCFEVESYVRNIAELERYFPQYLNLINVAVERHRELYNQKLEVNNSLSDVKSSATEKEHKVVS